MDEVKAYADYYKMDPQGEDESDLDFRNRVAGELRDMGLLIEAHEVHRGKRWDDPDGGGDVLTGVMGAMAQAMQGVDYGSKGYRQIGDDIAAGHIVQNPKPDLDPMVLLIAALMK